jgi:phosphopantetheinyl transferase
VTGTDDASHGVDVTLVDVNAVRHDLKSKISSVDLPDDMLSRAATRGEDWLLCHVALRLVLQRWVGDAASAASFDVEPGGRPRLANSDVEFSLSHSGAYALIGVTRGQGIGVDFEAPRALTMIAERRARLLQAAARLSLVSSDPIADGDTNDANVLKAWVALEAIAKVDGRGIGNVLTTAGVVGGPAGRASPEAAAHIRVLTPRDGLPPGCVGAVAAARLPSSLTLQLFTLNAVDPALA